MRSTRAIPSEFTDTAEAARIRDSMTALPRGLGLPLTLLTGKPHTGQRPIRFTPGVHLAGTVSSISTGLIISATAIGLGSWWLPLLAIGWAATLHGARNARLMIYHQAAHRNLWGRPWLDRAVGRVIAGVLLVQDFDRYSAEHIADHHAIHHMTVRDPTVQAILIGLELSPGMSRRAMWRKLVFAKLLSPVFHVRFLTSRVQSYLRPASWTLRTVTITCYASAAALLTWSGLWTFVIIAWLLPITVLFQVSNTLRLCVKHTFPAPDEPDRRSKAYFAKLTNAIFLGERAPQRGLGLRDGAVAWIRWAARMLLVHLPARYLVLTGDTVVHDYHHRRPMDRNWASYIFAREAHVAGGHPGWPAYRQVWGLIPAINVVFDSLRDADPREFSRENVAATSHMELFEGFDD